MISMLTTAPGEKQPSVADFTKHYAPWIIVATVIVPLIVAAVTNWLRSHHRYVLTKPDTHHTPARTAANHLFVALVAPLGELAGRLGWGVLIVLGLILTYTLCYNIWSSFAFPFYLDFLHYSKDEVAFASKIFGIFMTMVGISLGGYLFLRIGRIPTILIGADPAGVRQFRLCRPRRGRGSIDMVRTCCFSTGWRLFGSDERMTRLLLAISYENISTGIAGRRSSLICRASSARTSPPCNMRCCRR